MLPIEGSDVKGCATVNLPLVHRNTHLEQSLCGVIEARASSEIQQSMSVLIGVCKQRLVFGYLVK